MTSPSTDPREVVELNFDGLIGPSHNYAGLSLGNVASAGNKGSVSRPRQAALQGLAKMRRVMGLGLPQGFFLPHERPHTSWLRTLGFSGSDTQVCADAVAADPQLFANAASASAMWTANAATVSPAADTRDGRVHLTPANLSSMTHRSLEWTETVRQLKLMFADERFFAVHDPVPARFGDEGAANFMRLARSHGDPGLEIFVFGEDRGGKYPARQALRASEAVARKHGVEEALFTAQSAEAIEAGAFHNDVVAVANGRVLFAHERAFEYRAELFDEVRRLFPEVEIIEVPDSEVSLEDAIASYLFNSQLLSLPDGSQHLVLPTECRDTPSVKAWLGSNIGGNGPIHGASFLDVRESMRNGGGPACLRLRVAAGAEARAAIDTRFLLDDEKADTLERLIEEYWPDSVSPGDLAAPDFWEACWAARRALLAQLGF
ncbi:succinylarginine dihydrolase [Pacificimonas flava]|uniref:N-succinylarginine dihydrolase n=2 Tax=Pacificimonas TaxID=1960290 RepID=A0A219B4C0_9SPHN|nr:MULTISPECIES: N-succinylarginine dihydrolase [Pacificimonas]MBZ6377336.1 N-succinylarginine dihydrolase [Pacificimonas aurantium]OWV32956.1 succinylarginine dihydrolase [Pacificimonas flava]